MGVDSKPALDAIFSSLMAESKDDQKLDRNKAAILISDVIREKNKYKFKLI
jgi:hypothetical protein